MRRFHVKSTVRSAGHPYGRWFVIARAAGFLAAVLSMVLFIATLPTAYAQLQTVCAEAACADDLARIKPGQVQTLQALGVSLHGYAVFTLIISVIATLVYLAVGGLIFWRKSDDRMALLVAFALVFMGSTTTSVNAIEGTASWWFPVTIAGYAGSVLLVLVFYLFPDGRWVPRWTRWLALIFAVSEAIYHFEPMLPFGLNRVADAVDMVIWPGSLLGIVIAQAYRYRYVSTPQQRQQTKWVVFGLSMAMLGLFGLIFIPVMVVPSLVNSLYGVAGNTIIICLLLLIPLSFGMAILRSRLYDIDLIINRTLVYGMLTVMLALIYGGTVVIIQQIVAPLLGGNDQIAIVASTLAIAALFQPLRRRIQDLIDRRFYRQKYDAQKTLAAFNARLRDETNLEQASADLIGVVQQTLQPECVSLWLREPKEVRSK